MQKLTDHFCLEEFTRSDTATRCGIPNEPGIAAISNLQNLCQEVLEPLRQHFGCPIIINSGFRSRALNAHPEVKGVSNSQHLKGEAADIRIPNVKTGLQWFWWIQKYCNFDQLLFEKNAKGVTWIHVSCKRDLKKNRKMVRNYL